MSDPGSRIPDLGSRILDDGYGTQRYEVGVHSVYLGSRFSDPGSRILDDSCGTQRCEVGIHCVKGSGIFIPDPDFYPSRNSDPGSQIPDLGSRISDPGSRFPDVTSTTKEEGWKKFVVLPVSWKNLSCIPNPRVKEAPDPGFAPCRYHLTPSQSSRILSCQYTLYRYCTNNNSTQVCKSGDFKGSGSGISQSLSGFYGLWKPLKIGIKV